MSTMRYGLEAEAARAARLTGVVRAATLIIVLLSLRIEAAVFTVTHVWDSGPGSLRQAILDANASPGSNTISCTNIAGTITLGSRLPAFTGTTTLLGPGADLLTVSGSNAFRVFEIASGANVSISKLTIANGYATNTGGGGVLNAGRLSVIHCAVIQNESAPGPGGGIHNQGTLTLLSSVVASNIAAGASWRSYYVNVPGDMTGRGGGIYLSDGSLTVSNCLLTQNQALGTISYYYNYPTSGEGLGGALFIGAGQAVIACSTLSSNSAVGSRGGPEALSLAIASSGANANGGAIVVVSNSAARLTMVNSTVSGNAAKGGDGGGASKYGGDGGNAAAGGIFAATVGNSLVNCTIYQNVAVGGRAGPGGTVYPHHDGLPGYGYAFGIYVPTGSVTLKNTIIQSSSGGMNSQGYNLLESASGLTGLVETDLTNVSFSFGPLQNNGGSTPTHALPLGNPAINAGTATGAPVIDQRGARRPQGSAVDIGAYELVTGPPQILGQPLESTAALGLPLRLSVWAEGVPPLSYQWRKDGRVIPWGTNATLKFAKAGEASGGQYTVVVSNHLGTVTSAVAHVTLRNGIQVSTPGGGQVAIRAPGAPGFYEQGQTVVLAAVPAPGWQFLHWLGDLTGTNPTQSVVVTRSQSIEAVFGTTIATRTSGYGSGSVVVDPAGPLYPYGTKVRLTGVPNPGSFNYRPTPLLLTVTNANQATEFEFQTLSAGQTTLTLSTPGHGSVTSGSTRNYFTSNETVTLTASPDPDQTFLGWSGDASGAQNPLTVVMNQSKTITANFSRRPRLELAQGFAPVRTEGFRFTLSGDLGRAYGVQCSGDLLQWTRLVAITNAFGTVQFTDVEATNRAPCFYRAVEVP